jgi:hypothetical protein
MYHGVVVSGETWARGHLLSPVNLLISVAVTHETPKIVYVSKISLEKNHKQRFRTVPAYGKITGSDTVRTYGTVFLFYILLYLQIGQLFTLIFFCQVPCPEYGL